MPSGSQSPPPSTPGRPGATPVAASPPKAPTLTQLWSAHPDSHALPFPCRSATGRPYFQNQCAIKMGVALSSCGADLSRFKGARCWYEGHSHHTLRAQELADWLRTETALLGQVEVRRKVKAGDFLGRTGLVFFQNFWGEGNQGDHIDLWDGDELRAGAPDYFERSQQVWFWALPLAAPMPAPAPGPRLAPAQGGDQLVAGQGPAGTPDPDRLRGL